MVGTWYVSDVGKQGAGEPAAIYIAAPARQMPLVVRPAGGVSDEALAEFCRINRDLRIERTPQGELVIMSPTGGETGRRNFTLIVRFGEWVQRDGTGIGFDSSTGFLLENGAERSPDVAWIRNERWEALMLDQRARFVPLCPDFVVELRSPSDSLDSLQQKMSEYLECGAALGWLIDPEERRVHVYRPGAAAECLEDPAVVTGDPVLPGFELALSAIW